jgi:hypothetical protein
MAEPFSTLNQAVAACGTGETVIVDAGTYDEQIYQFFGTSGMTFRGWSWYTTPFARPVHQYSYNYNYALYLYYTDDFTYRGFELSYPGSYYVDYVAYVNYCDNFTFIDNVVTGTSQSWYMHGMYLYYLDTANIENNLWTEMNSTNTYPDVYPMYYYRGYGTNTFKYNEITKLANEAANTPQWVYATYFYYLPGGSEINNNLIHHIAPNAGTYGYMYMYGVRAYRCYTTTYIYNNVVDNLTCDLGQNTYSSSCYGYYLYNGGSSSYQYSAHNNIASNLTGTNTSPYYYGMYCYNIASGYNCLYNIQDWAYQGTSNPPTNITDDPLFVNNDDDTEPYDYHLDTGSPCIGTGYGGQDMGVYGGSTPPDVIGLLSPR